MKETELTSEDFICVVPIHNGPKPKRYRVFAKKNEYSKEILLVEGDDEEKVWWVFETNSNLKKYCSIRFNINHGDE